MYAINLSDWQEQGSVILLWMIADVVQGRKTVDCEPGRVDGKAVQLECGEERGGAIVEIARRRWGRNQLRFYRKTEEAATWRRV